MMKNDYRSLVVEIQNELGLHARPSASFVKTANEFKSNIFVECGNMRVDGKSILGLLMLGASRGTKLTITADGPDANAAIQGLVELIDNKFYEV
jgi:phosphocarrier protein HPr